VADSQGSKHIGIPVSKPDGFGTPIRPDGIELGTSYFPQPDFWGISVTSGDPLLSRIFDRTEPDYRP